MPSRAFRIAYDGAPFHGFQRQPDVATVEDALFDALRDLGVLAADADAPREYAAAGRTDAGVSAVAQTVAFEAPDWLTPRALNGELPPDVRAWASTDPDEGFHATHDAASRRYLYHLHAPAAALDAAREAAARFEGTHDFHNFTPADGDAERTVLSATVERDGPYLLVSVRAEGFVREQVRRMVSLLGAVARDEAPLERVAAALGDRTFSGPQGIPAAPAPPLVLVDVAYPSLRFRIDEAAAADAREVFDARRVEHRTHSRVAGAVADRVADGR